MMKKIIIADDSTTVQKAICIALNNFQVDVTETTSLVNLQSLLQASSYDAVIIDGCLTGIDTPEELAQLTKKYQAISFIVIVGTYDKHNLGLYHQLGLKHILSKPFTSEDLAEKADSIGLHRLESSSFHENKIEREDNSSRESPLQEQQMENMLKKLVQEKLSQDLPSIIQSYCDKNFKDLAEQILNKEIDRLVEKK